MLWSTILDPKMKMSTKSTCDLNKYLVTVPIPKKKESAAIAIFKKIHWYGPIKTFMEYGESEFEKSN